MKKSKFLIPALSVASVGAVVAPMVTSCAKTNGLSFDIIKVGLLQDYTPMKPMAADKVIFQKGEYEGEAEEEAMIAYAREVAKNPNILADDFINTAVQSFNPYNDDNPKQLSMSVSNISVEFIRIDGSDEPVFSFDSTVSYVDADDDTNIMSLEFRKVPFMFGFGLESEGVQILPPYIISACSAELYSMYEIQRPELKENPQLEDVIAYIAALEEYYNQIDAVISQFNVSMKMLNTSIKLHMKEIEKDGTVYTDTTIEATDFETYSTLMKPVEQLLPYFSYIPTNYFQNATVEEE